MERTLLRPRFVRKFSNIQVLPRGPSFPSLPSATDMQYTDSYYFYQTMLLVTEFLREKTWYFYYLEGRRISTQLEESWNLFWYVGKWTSCFSSIIFIFSLTMDELDTNRVVFFGYLYLLLILMCMLNWSLNTSTYV